MLEQWKNKASRGLKTVQFPIACSSWRTKAKMNEKDISRTGSDHLDRKHKLIRGIPDLRMDRRE